jgi:hypothetical protein
MIKLVPIASEDAIARARPMYLSASKFAGMYEDIVSKYTSLVSFLLPPTRWQGFCLHCRPQCVVAVKDRVRRSDADYVSRTQNFKPLFEFKAEVSGQCSSSILFQIRTMATRRFKTMGLESSLELSYSSTSCQIWFVALHFYPRKESWEAEHSLDSFRNFLRQYRSPG